MSEENNQGVNNGGSPDSEARINELVAKIQGLQTQLDRKEQLEAQERENAEAARANQQQNLGYDPNSDEVKQWAPWLAPKLAPFLAERDRVIVTLADKIDELETMRRFPEYGDEEYQAKVRKLINDTHKSRGVRLSRVDAITFLKGQEYMEKGRQSDSGEQVPQQQQIYSPRRVNSPVESGGGLGTTRAAQNTNQKNPNDMSIEEFEAQYGELPV